MGKLRDCDVHDSELYEKALDDDAKFPFLVIKLVEVPGKHAKQNAKWLSKFFSIAILSIISAALASVVDSRVSKNQAFS